jgi:hypothetical protein
MDIKNKSLKISDLGADGLVLYSPPGKNAVPVPISINPGCPASKL